MDRPTVGMLVYFQLSVGADLPMVLAVRCCADPEVQSYHEPDSPSCKSCLQLGSFTESQVCIARAVVSLPILSTLL
jgi:hypothetical protein